MSNFRKRFGKNIVKNYRKAKPSKLEYQYNDVPSFREFIEFLLDQSISNMNIHWIPIYNLCMPCHVNYNLIGRYIKFVFLITFIFFEANLKVEFPRNKTKSLLDAISHKLPRFPRFY